MMRLNLRPDWLAVTRELPDRIHDEDTGQTRFDMPRISRFLGRANAVVHLPRRWGGFATLRVFGAPNWHAHYDRRKIVSEGLDGLNEQN